MEKIIDEVNENVFKRRVESARVEIYHNSSTSIMKYKQPILKFISQ